MRGSLNLDGDPHLEDLSHRYAEVVDGELRIAAVEDRKEHLAPLGFEEIGGDVGPLCPDIELGERS